MESPPLLNPSSIISLNLAFKHLTGIEQIKQYKNLIELDLSGNSFKDPETCLKILNHFPYLKKINLAYNKLRSVPTLPKNIEILILNNNSLSSLHEKILQNPRLTTLDLSNNFVTDITILQKLPNLKYIFLKNNKIKSFGAIAVLDRLQEVDLEGNNVDNIEDLNSFNNHPTIKILSIRNTPLNTEQSANRNSQASLVSLPFFREGAYCRSARALKSSFTYTNMLETSNPNRSVLVNKSLINSKKQVSEDDLSDEFSFDQLPNEAINDSLLGSIRSNILEVAAQGISENSTRRDRSNNLSLDMMNKGILPNNGVKAPSREKEVVKAGSSRSQEPQQNPEELAPKKPKQVPLLKRKNKFDMRLDLSTILKNDRIGFEGLSYADFQKPDTKKIDHGHHVKMEFPVPQFSSSNRSQAAENKFPIPAPTENERANTESMKFSANQTLNSFVNQLESGRPISSYRITFQNDSLSLNEFEGLKRENQDLRKIREELAQHVAGVEKDNESLNKKANMLQNENKSMISHISTLEAENKRLVQSQKEMEAKMKSQNQQLQKVLNTYAEKEDEGEVNLQQAELEDYDSLLKMVQEKMKKLEELTQVDMNARILEKFDQLRNYYRKKQERFTMVINDLESKIHFQLNEKIAHLERDGSVMQTNYQTLLKKYMKLKQKQPGEEKKKQNKTNQSNTSINATRHPLRALNLSLEAPDTSPEIHDRGKKGKLGKLEILLNPKIHFRKEGGKTDDNISKLKLENYQLRTSLEGIQRKFEVLLRENDDLKTVSNRNTHSLKMRVKELERENSKLVSVMNLRGMKPHRNAHNTSFERNCDMSLKTHNMSCEDEPSYSIIEGLRPMKQEKEKVLQGDTNLKDHLVKLKKKCEVTDKELKIAKEKNTSLVKKMNNFVDFARKSNDMLNEYPQLKNLCFQFQDAVQNT